MSGKSAHLQIYVDGELVRDSHVIDIGTTPGLSFSEFGHEVDNGDFVPLKLTMTAYLSRCPFGHDDDGEPCI